MIDLVNRMYGGAWDGSSILVYGLTACGYMEISLAFGRLGVTDYTHGIGIDDTKEAKPKSRGVVQIKSQQYVPGNALNSLVRICKAAITNIVFLNYVRLEQQKSIVPIIFCMEKEGMKESDGLSLETITDKLAPNVFKIISASEIRRAYKHCTDPYLSEKIKRVAQMSFRFVRVIKNLSPYQDPFAMEEIQADQNSYAIEEIPAPWKNPLFEPRFAARIAGRQRFGVSDWREQVNNLVAEYDHTQVY